MNENIENYKKIRDIFTLRDREEDEESEDETDDENLDSSNLDG